MAWWQVGKVENGENLLEAPTISPFLSAGDPCEKGAEAVKEVWG